MTRERRKRVAWGHYKKKTEFVFPPWLAQMRARPIPEYHHFVGKGDCPVSAVHPIDKDKIPFAYWSPEDQALLWEMVAAWVQSGWPRCPLEWKGELGARAGIGPKTRHWLLFMFPYLMKFEWCENDLVYGPWDYDYWNTWLPAYVPKKDIKFIRKLVELEREVRRV